MYDVRLDSRPSQRWQRVWERVLRRLGVDAHVGDDGALYVPGHSRLLGLHSADEALWYVDVYCGW